MSKVPKSRSAERPIVVANFAMTVDGKISTRNFSPSLFTSPADKARLQEIRAAADGILVGRGTVAADSMSLGLSRKDLQAQRIAAGKSPAPVRAIISNSGRLDPRWKVFANTQSPLVVFSTTQMKIAARTKVAGLCDLRLFEKPQVPLLAALRVLREEYGVRRLVCEGGAQLFRSLVEADFVDEVYVTLAPLVFGGKRAPTLTGLPGPFLKAPSAFRIVKMEQIGDECFLHFRRRR